MKVNGKILDLGAGRNRPSYYRFLDIENRSEIVTVDISAEKNPDVVADLEGPFPFRSESFDCIFAFNLLEHIYDYENLLNEAYRVLKNGGYMYGVVPFLVNVHGDPHDYFRYTETALSKMLNEVGFWDINTKALGFGPFTAAYSQIQSYIPQILRIPFIFLGIVIDRIIKSHGCFPLAYLFICEKQVVL